MSEDEQPRIIKKYPNRRLYDTERSQYVTLQQIRSLVLDEIPFIVIDQKSEDDITRSILLQIILEQESETNPLFSNDNLERFIRYYNAGAHTGFSDYIGKSMSFFQQQQREFSKAVSGVASHNPMSFWTDMTQKNIDSWRQMMGLGPEKDDPDVK
ncbi:MAG: polyhydroxyalkanoate synthesis repressor PhaR [Gammaproteobacteria bacterium]|nr:polyhydroxyalkanoate synthesis repressor PhaR [Gammaproteobacteria bacterium]